jgi:hypothetical protein
MTYIYRKLKYKQCTKCNETLWETRFEHKGIFKDGEIRDREDICMVCYDQKRDWEHSEINRLDKLFNTEQYINLLKHFMSIKTSG